MDYFWFSTVLIILVIVIIFGSLRQYRVKKILTDTQQIIKEMVGGRGGSGGHGSGGHGSGGHGSGGHGSGGRGNGGHGINGRGFGNRGHGSAVNFVDRGGHGRFDRRGDHRGYYRYYGDPYLGSYGGWGSDGWGWDWGRGWDWPYWTRWNWWWPNYDTCIDYARNSCVGAIDYQSCYDVEYRNCPYI